MNVTCPECRSIFRVDPAKVPATGVRARCSICGGIMAIAGGTLPVAVTGGATISPRGSVTAAAPIAPAISPPLAPLPVPPPVVAPVAAPVPPPVAAPVPPPVAAPVPPSVAAAIDIPVVVPPVSPLSPARVTPALGTPVTAPAPATADKRPINPFLAADPAQRARRLARALVSDLLAYYPDRREEGLREGTLRQLFREDIKKSYEEYVDQIGKEAADGSSYFQEALNDILAGGRQLF